MEDMRLMLEGMRRLEDKFDRELADSVLEVGIRENRELIKQLMGDDNMSEALLEIMEPMIIEIRRQAKTEGIEQGIRCLVDAFRDYGHSDEEIKEAIIKKYGLSEEEAVSYL